MFPLRWNFPFRKKDGSLSTIQDEIDSGGGGGEPYVLPTASPTTKGGIKVGEGLTMDGEVLNVSSTGSGYEVLNVPITAITRGMSAGETYIANSSVNISTYVLDGYTFLGFVGYSDVDKVFVSYRLDSNTIRLTINNTDTQSQTVTVNGNAIFVKQLEQDTSLLFENFTGSAITLDRNSSDVVDTDISINMHSADGYSFIGFIPSSDKDYVINGYSVVDNEIHISMLNTYYSGQSVIASGIAIFAK